MKQIVFTATFIFAALSQTIAMTNNPILNPWNTPHATIPFNEIKISDYKPAFEAGILQSKENIAAIIDSKEEPTFENTIAALEYSEEILSRVGGIFFNLNSSNTNEEMQKLAMEISPMLTEHSNDIALSEPLFLRIKRVYDKRSSLSLSTEEARLLERTYKTFARGGASLPKEQKDSLRAVSERLSILELTFDQNLLGATNAYSLNITDENKLSGLPQFAKDAAALEAKSKGKTGWVFTLQAPSIMPVLQYANSRELREELWRAYNTRCFGGQKFNNLDIVKEISALRLKRANLLGYATHADYVLEDRMAEKPATVTDFLEKLIDKSISYAQKDIEEIKAFAKEQGHTQELMPWDFGYYSEKLKQERYSISDEMLKPYFKLENAQEAMFQLAGKLYGISFKENSAIPTYHPDVKAYEVFDNNGSYLAVLYLDYFPRQSKQGGAWMNPLKELTTYGGTESRPHISVVCNFTKPTEESPSLLTFDEVSTMLHEFGHSLHGIFSKGTYTSLLGTNVAWDFVELPSQIMENWALEPEYLKSWARHYKTGEVIPQELITKITESKNYLSGYSNIRQVTLGTIDMAWHTITQPVECGAEEFETKATAKIRLMPKIEGTATSTSFSHIFAGGYSSGYYSYKWAEVLEADAFSLFAEKGIFDKQVAAKFRTLLSSGNTKPAMDLFVEFRGHTPSIEPLLKKMGLE